MLILAPLLALGATLPLSSALASPTPPPHTLLEADFENGLHLARESILATDLAPPRPDAPPSLFALFSTTPPPPTEARFLLVPILPAAASEPSEPALPALECYETILYRDATRGVVRTRNKLGYTRRLRDLLALDGSSSSSSGGGGGGSRVQVEGWLAGSDAFFGAVVAGARFVPAADAAAATAGAPAGLQIYREVMRHVRATPGWVSLRPEEEEEEAEEEESWKGDGWRDLD